MAELDKQTPVTMQELLVSTLAQGDASHCRSGSGGVRCQKIRGMSRHNAESAFRHNLVRNYQAGVMDDPVILPCDFHVRDAGPIGEEHEYMFRNAPVCGLGLS
jgi:hypothetical protein